MPNATINCWVDYIRTNFFFELVYKKGKIFGLDRLLRRKWYSGDPVLETFKDGSEDGGGDITIRKENLTVDDSLRLKEFYDGINLREGFYYGIILDDPLMNLGQLEARIKDGPECLRAVFTKAVEHKEDKNSKNSEDNFAEEELGNYDDNRYSDHVKNQEEMLSKIKRYLITKDLQKLGVMTTDQARFVWQASHYWLDKENEKLYRKNTGRGNFQLVIGISEKMQLLKACYDKIEHQGAYATGRMLQQHFWWPEIEEDVIWYVKSYHLCQIRQRIVLEMPPVVTHMPLIFQVLNADIVHMMPLLKRLLVLGIFLFSF